MSQVRASHDVRIWSIVRYRGSRRTSYIVRWAVSGRRSQRTFATAKLAEGFRTDLVVAARDGQSFDSATGLPLTMLVAERSRTWFAHAVDFAGMKWPAASPRHRKGIAEALVGATLALTMERRGGPSEHDLRRAMYSYAFHRPARDGPVPEKHAAALSWLEDNSLPLSALSSAATLRRVLDALSLTLDGRPAARSTVARKRATFHNALEYAVELEVLEVNALKRIHRRAEAPDVHIDRGVVANPDQARRLLASVWASDPPLAAFFACLYFAGLRPSEARSLRRTDCALPGEGWGELVLRGSQSDAGSAWTDSGRPTEERGLKHRGRSHRRRVPAHPELVATLTRHIEQYGTGVDNRLFVARTGRRGAPISPPFNSPVGMGTVYRAWDRARLAVLSPEQYGTSLARRPYDLRHACLSTWLNAGVSPARVAEWAGHSVPVLLRVYAQCVDGEDEAARHRIEATLG